MDNGNMKLGKESTNIHPIRPKPRIIPRAEHNISRNHINDSALKVLYRLKSGGYDAYLVGGSVRDLLLGREPKDFDVATNAHPEQIRELFRNSRLIGRRFRLAHVRYGREIIEVSTFRAQHSDANDDGHIVEGRIIRDNVYGCLEEDVWRRDFTVNALYYSIENFSVIDYVGGLNDIKAGHIRLIGDPAQRYIEDPVRMLRAVRFASKLGFRIDPEAEKPIFDLNTLLEEMPPARLFEEVIKLFSGGVALQTFEQLRRFNLFGVLFPQTEEVLAEQEGGYPHTLLINALKNTDLRVSEDKPITPGYLIAALLWTPMINMAKAYMENGMSELDAITLASDVVISKQVTRTSMPRRFSQMARDIWQLQVRLKRTNGSRPIRLIQHPKFRAGYDFLLLRAATDGSDKQLAQWWTEFIAKQGPVQSEVVTQPRSKRRRRNRHRTPKSSNT
jgi:poly(A) polymerase